MEILIDAGLAGLPLLLLFVLMVGQRWSASRAGVAGLVAALLLAWLWFGFDTATGAEGSRVRATAGALAEAAFSTATILWILLAALATHLLQEQLGATATLRRALEGVTSDPRLAGILIAWFFALFLEGAAGFGTPVALTAPLLLTFGYRPVDAVAIALVGHAAGVSFGALGTPVLTQATITGLDAGELARATVLYHATLSLILLGFAMLLMERGLRGGGPVRDTIWPWVALAWACFVVPSFVLARQLGPELPTLGGALLGAALFVPVLMLWQSRQGGLREDPAVRPHQATRGRELLVAAAPYLALIGLVVLTRIIAPIREPLQELRWSWQLFSGFQGNLQPLYHPGTLLFVSFLLGAFLQRAGLREIGGVLRVALQRLAPVTLALLAMLAISRLMVHSGMTAALALAAGAYLGAAWPLIAPSIGILGTFTTGSATASNVLFSDVQLETAERLGMAPMPLLGAQGAGAAVGNVIAPHNIIAGAATVGLKEGEGEVLRRTVPVCIIYAVGLGLMALVWTRILA